MNARVVIGAPSDPSTQDEGAFGAYVKKTFYQMNHRFRPSSDQVSIKVQDLNAGMFRVAYTSLCGELRAVGERNWSHIRSDNAKMFVLWFPIEGSLNMIHNGRREIVHSGEFMMTSSSLPHRGTVELSHGDKYRSLMITVPFGYVTDIIPGARAISGLKFQINKISLKMSLEIFTMLLENADEFEEDCAQHHVSAALYGVFSFIRAAHLGPSKVSSIRELRAKEVLSFIDRHLAEADLTAKKIGEGCSISSRYVHSLLQQRGTSLKDYVWRSRYDQARERIADPRYSHETIGTIASDLGFRSNAHFSTGFRKVFGKSPSEVRHCALELGHLAVITGLDR